MGNHNAEVNYLMNQKTHQNFAFVIERLKSESFHFTKSTIQK